MYPTLGNLCFHSARPLAKLSHDTDVSVCLGVSVHVCVCVTMPKVHQ